MTRVLIDTCAWIDFFKSKTGALGNLVAELIETNQAAITGVVIAELLQGIKQEKESQRLRVLFHSIYYLPTEDNDWFAGSRYFCESFYGHPCPTSGKNYATAHACGGPSRPASFVGYPARGIQHHSRNDSTRCRKACIFTPQAA